jgi:hypothetical protein
MAHKKGEYGKQNLNLGLEPSILIVIPNDTEDVKVRKLTRNVKKIKVRNKDACL